MLTFLNSLLAWSLVAAAIPILIHLFTRKKLKKIPFSTMQFLLVMQKEKIRQVKLRQLLLLLLRTMIILLLVLAFMRPTLKNTDFVVGQRARTSEVLIIDNSLSMSLTSRGESLLSGAKRRAQEIVQLLKPGDDVTILAAAKPAGVVGEAPIFNQETAQSQIAEIEQTASSTDLQGALEMAYKILSESESLNKEVYVLSDKRATLTFDGTKTAPAQNVHVFLLSWPGETVRNLALAEVAIQNQIFEVGKVVEVKVTVANTGDVNENGRMVYLLSNGNRVAQSQIDVPVGQERSLTFRVVPSERGYQLLTAELENDQILLDNRRYAAFSILEKLKVLLVGPRPENRRFVRLALQPNENGSVVALDEKDSARLASTPLTDYDVVIFCNLPKLDPAFSQRLKAYLDNGGGVLFFLGDDVDLRNYNQEIFQRFQIGKLGETLGSQTDGDNILRLGEINYDHPIFEDIFDREDKIRKIESPAFKFAVYAHPDHTAQTIMRYSNNAPFLLEQKVGDGSVLAFVVSADDSWSDLTYKGLFVPLLNRSVWYVAEKGNTFSKESLVGQAAETGVVGANFGEFSVETPEKTSVRVRPEIRDGRYLVSFAKTQNNGFYTLLADGHEKFIWAVNFDKQELETPVLDVAAFRSFAGANNVFQLPATIDAEQTLDRVRYGKELWQIFLLLALFALVAETLVFREKAEA